MESKISAGEYYDEGYYHGKNDTTPVSTNVNYMDGWHAGQVALELSGEKNENNSEKH